jgi:hypothetical protein
MIALSEWIAVIGLGAFVILIICVWAELDPDKEFDMDAIRHCPARGCGKPLLRRPDEVGWDFERRLTCGAECAASIRADGRYVSRQRAAELASEAPRLVEELTLWHETIKRNPPTGPARWWR